MSRCKVTHTIAVFGWELGVLLVPGARLLSPWGEIAAVQSGWGEIAALNVLLFTLAINSYTLLINYIHEVSHHV